MNTKVSSLSISLKLWLCSALILSVEIFVYSLVIDFSDNLPALFFSLFAATIGSIPAFLVLLILLPLIRKFITRYTNRLSLFIFLLLIIAAAYALPAAFISDNPFSKYSSVQSFLQTAAMFYVALNTSNSIFYHQTKTQIPCTKIQCRLLHSQAQIHSPIKYG